MNNVEANAKLEMKNVISYRGKIYQQQMINITKEMNEIAEKNGAKKIGPIVTSTYSVENNGLQTMMDVEIQFSLSKQIEVPNNYKFKPLFRISNAVRIRHCGNPALLQQSANKLMMYIKENKLTPITTGYNVTVQEQTSPDNANDMIIDMYVGVTDNIL